MGTVKQIQTKKGSNKENSNKMGTAKKEKVNK